MAIVWKADFFDGEIMKITPVPTLSNSYTPPRPPTGDKPFDNCICNFSIQLSSNLPFPECSQLPTFPVQEDSTMTLSCVIGRTAITQLDRLIEICVTKLVAGEESTFSLRPYREYDLVSCHLYMKLNSFETPELCEMSGGDLCTIASQLKEEGRGHFEAKRFTAAFYKFSRGLKNVTLIDEMKCPDNIQQERRSLISSLYNNLAACHLQKGNKCDYRTVIELCSKALDYAPANIKAFYRRGVALMELKEFEKARQDFLRAKDLDPTNEAIPAKLATLTQKENAFNQKHYGSGMRKMFSS